MIDQQLMHIIDPPVGPASAPEAIRAWIERLQEMPADENVDLALDEARHWLQRAARRAAPAAAGRS